MNAAWTVSRLSGPAAELHGREQALPARREVTLCQADGPALVLGSAQDGGVVDRARVEAAGLALVRRRTGGGAVLLRPDQMVWVDVEVPMGDVLWEQDVTRSFSWLGAAWAAAAADLGAPGPRPHTGAMEVGRWGRVVCFAGRGPGEVTVEGRKLVGLAQRRTRRACRFQCAVLSRWDPGELVSFLSPASLGDEDRSGATAELAGVAVGLDQLGLSAVADDVLAALVARLP